MSEPTNEQELKQLVESLHADCPPACPHTVEPESDWLEKAITAHTNAEIAKVLDRLEAQKATCYDCGHDNELMEAVPYIPLTAIQAERAKLKEVK